MEHYTHSNSHPHSQPHSPSSFRQKLPLCFSGCFGKNHHMIEPSSNDIVSSGASTNKRLLRTTSSIRSATSRSHSQHHHHYDFPDIKDRCRLFMYRMSHRPSRRHSADFSYDALSYSQNFDHGDDDDNLDDFPLRSFSARLPQSPLPALQSQTAASQSQLATTSEISACT